MTFMGIELSKEEQVFLTSVIVEFCAEERTSKLSDDEVFHKVVEKAMYKDRYDNIKRLLKKEIKRAELNTASNIEDAQYREAYLQGYRECAEKFKECLQE